MAQKIFFKEHHSKLNLFGSSDEDRSEIASLTKTRLVVTSNKFGFAAIAYNNAIKIVTISALESSTDQVTPVASIDLEANCECVYLDLDFAETHLYVLTCSMPNENSFEYAIYVYALESISFDKTLPQSPSCLNRINLERDNQLIVDFCASTNEQEALALCKNNGIVQIVTNLLDKQPKIVSKPVEAFCVCWSPKGKQLACCSRNNKLNLLDRDLTLKNTYECLKPDHIPTNISWLAKKHFIVFGVEASDAQTPVPYYIEVSTDKNSHQSYSIKSIDYSQLTYSFDVEKSPSMDLAFINDWNLILCSNSKNSEIALLQRPPNSEIYDVLEIEDYRCQVPLSNDSMDLCPLGMVVNFNCKSQVKLDKLDLQPPSPMVIILSDNGLLITYFVINLDSSNASICIPPSKMQFKSIPSIQQISQKPQSQEQQQPSLGGSGVKPSGSAPTGSMFSFNSTSNNSLFNLNSSQQPTPATIPTANSQQQFNFKNLPSDQSTTILSSSSSTLSQLVTSKTPSQTFPFQAPASTSQTPLPTFSAPVAAVPPQAQPDLSSAQQQQAPFSFAQQPKQPQQVSFNIPPQQQPSQFSAPKTSLPQFPVQQQQQQQQQQQIQPQFEQPKNVVVAPKPAPQQQQQQLQQPKSISSISLAEKINEFAKQINELKSSAAKLFDGKELAANLLDYSVIKKSKQVREKYLKINEEMQSLHDKCVELRETLMTDFRNFEKLRLLKFNASNPKIASSMKQFELDPITREKYENIKKLYAYISRELPNIKSHVDLYKKKKQDQSMAFVSFDDVFESIRSIEILINQNSKHVGKLIDQIKLLKIDNNHLIRDLNLVKLKEKPINEEDRKDQSIRDMSTYLEDSLETSKAASRLYQTAMDESDLDKRVSRLELKGAGSSSDRDTLFFTQLYEILRKRKQIPVQEVFLRRLDLYDERFDRVDETTSVTHLDTSSTIHKEISPKTFAPPVTPTATFRSKETTLDSSFLKINSPNVVVNLPQAQPQASHPPQFGSFAPNTVVVQQSQVQSQPQFQQQQQQPKIVIPTKPPVADAEPSTTLGGSKGILPKFAPPTSTPTPVSTLLPQSGGAQQAPPTQPSQTPLFSFQSQPSASAASTSQPTPVVQNVQSQQIQVPKASQPPTTPPHQTQPGPSILGGIVNKQQPPPAMSKATTSTPASTSQPSSLGGGLFSFNLAAPSATSSPAPTSQSQTPLFNLPGLSKPAAAATTSSQPPAFSFGTKSSIATSLFPTATTTTTASAQQPSEKTAETAKPSGPFTPVTPSQSSDSISVSQIVNTKVAETLSKAVSEPAKKEEAPKVEVVKKDEPAKPTEESSKEKEKEPPKPDEVKKPVESKQPEPEKTPSTTSEVKPETEKQPVVTTTTDKSEPAKPQSETAPTPQPPATNPAPATTTTTTTGFTLGATTPSMPSLFGTQPSSTTASTTASPFPSMFGAKPAATASTAAPFSLAQSSSTSTVNPFTAMTSQKPASNELDADMDASTNTMSSGLSFGGLGSSKPLNADAPKNVFGFSFGGGGASQTATSPTAAGSPGLIKPSVFGAPATTAATPAPAAGGILKTPTFTSPTSGSTGLFGSSTGAATGGGGGLFSQAGSGAGAGGLFSSFKSPDSKPPATSIFGAPATAASPPAAFGGAATFGGAPLFGTAPTFGASAAPAAAPMSTGLFGSVSSSQAPAFGGAPSFGSTESKPLFGAGALSGQTSGFSTLAAQGGSGATFGTFGQTAQMPQVGFGNLAQQQPQQNLFSSFSQPSQAPSFNAPNSSSFTAYRK